MVVFKDVFAIFFFYNSLTAPRTVSNTYAQVARAHSCTVTFKTSSAYHVKHVVLRAKGQLSY